MVKMFSFQEALLFSEEQSKRHLLLGNGFSIACRPGIFQYGKLFEQADFSKLSTSAKKVFHELGTQDFEKVISILRDSTIALKAYEDISAKLLTMLSSDADSLRELLVQTIASSHPEWPGELEEREYSYCKAFLDNFSRVYTLNYDLLLYWVHMHTLEGEDPSSDDGFRKPYENYDANYVTWDPSNSHDQDCFFLHGALHLFDTGVELQKYTWKNTKIRLIEQIRSALKKDLFPVFVAEGKSDEKLYKIRHNDYLAKAFRSFSEITGALFIYGHSLAINDEHYLKRIEKGKIKQLYVGLYGDPENNNNKIIIARAERMSVNRGKKRGGLEVFFFDAETANVWGNNPEKL